MRPDESPKDVPPGEAYLLDSGALLAYLLDAPGASKVERLLRQSEQGQARVMISAVDLHELYSRVTRLGGQEAFAEASYVIRQLPLQVLPFGRDEVEEIGELAYGCGGLDQKPCGSVVAHYYCRQHGWTLVTAGTGSESGVLVVTL
ncbi:MAG TPA: type II toxin-antitoxin system VapC family toxin [Firmicutes bacterium]|nr:type II toxin-antitoxin system VapC family toxin [Candidatus Fermentithermobacillaceae bacterium]